MKLQMHTHDLIIFGTKGDLAQRKLFPALYSLEKKNKLVDNTRIIGVSRSNTNTKEYIQIIYNALKKFLKEKINKKIWEKFKKRFIFCKMNINCLQDFKKLKIILKKKKHILLNYFAVSSNLFIKICKGLSNINCNSKTSKIIIEKPIGDSLKSFNFINKSIKKYFSEKQIFRIDHYLGKEALLNLITLKFFNPFFNNNFNKKTIDHIQITLSESLGIEKRWSYFDQTGQIIDMVQNHMLQIISIFAMNKPKSLKKKHICSEKIKILKSLYIKNNDIKNNISLGQYKSGKINNNIVPSYVNEENSKKNSLTETFAAIKLYINTKKWKNVPFYIRTGKRLLKKCSKIIIFLKKSSENLLKNNKKIFNNRIIINLQSPFNIKIKFFNKIPQLNSKFKLTSSEMLFNYKKITKNNFFPEEYEKLLLESMKGNQFLFVNYKEIKYSWKWIDSIIKIYKKNPLLLEYYSSGSWGPKSSEKLIKKDKRKWDNN
ncbi:glucose-6-phosphate dehydrogenase [Buchnera aphidicola]|uniref:Glucose-6-phosphate 1-dehydrogenase n=1 Tax=Buchnera aphidicola subsp. Cinara cedri (strain Cc) TaxID=372461 RepID=Q057M8_BUCCC|nr:glucose-6-phosphate dehydrogenase [Buchnera aphidicola]ABJ90671.1 glucose-6-phosphate 1-dehydrogenase [Buchnera aphidicola BCc]